jgi:ankyrin repeat protein
MEKRWANQEMQKSKVKIAEAARMSAPLKEFAQAIWSGDSSVVESLISGGVDVNARLPRSSLPPALVLAVERGEPEIVDILLRANARVDETDEKGVTACHAAAACGWHAVLALLLARQPNIAAADAGGRTAFYYAVCSCLTDGGRSALMLLEAGASLAEADPVDLFRFAAASTAAIEALLDRGVVVREIVSTSGTTPLHEAARHAHADVVAMLVNVCGVDVTRDRSGSTPLHLAGDYECATLLLAAGADPQALDGSGRTALHRSLRKINAQDVAPAMIAAGADLDAVNDTGETARQMLSRRVDAARRDIVKARIDFVRNRALQVCIGLQLLELDALRMCEVLLFACGPIAPLIPFHIWWKIATTVKHFREETKT